MCRKIKQRFTKNPMIDNKWKHFAVFKMFYQAYTWSDARSDIQVLLKYWKYPWDPLTVLQGVLYLKVLLYSSIVGIFLFVLNKTRTMSE